MKTRLRNCIAALGIILAAGAIAPFSHAQTNRAFELFLPSNDSDGAFLGIQMIDLTEEDTSKYKLDGVQGVIVRSVVEGSPAEAARLMEDDIILEFDGTKVRSATQLSRLVKETPPGRKVGVLISRDGKRESVSVRLADQRRRQADTRMRPIPAPPRAGNEDLFFGRQGPQDRGTAGERQPTPRLGIVLQPLSDQLAEFMGVSGENGILIGSVDEGSPSYGKLKAGDVIIRAGGKSMKTPEDLADLVHQETGGSITFQVIRNKKEMAVTVNLLSQDGRGFKL